MTNQIAARDRAKNPSNSLNVRLFVRSAPPPVLLKLSQECRRRLPPMLGDGTRSREGSDSSFGVDKKSSLSPLDAPFPASQLDTQNTQSSDELHPNDPINAARLDTCTSVDATTASRSMSPLRQEIRRLAAPLSKEQLIEIIASAAAVSPSVHKLVQATAIASPAARRIMVRNIHYNTTDAGFIAHFAQFGPLEDAAIVREKFGRSKGFGFVTFKNIESMHKCINSPLHLDGRKLFVKVAADPFSEFLSDGKPLDRHARTHKRARSDESTASHCANVRLNDSMNVNEICQPICE
eukprot:Gregarina_sp_Pseudo_9__3149@NODE_333_length_3135_cov_26_604005_g313_i0_p2_GENE_NODE_333_length_3135_cov_26_604005_g313_i0NODE_333_length_3135_cov_26_604005_g313_i0_p2_ORF_typecomplete_len294_score28_66RRM_1/PF00076_22/3_3e14RRM_7/PF16367_5/0_02_NODE_333_length_3135_cov_26_604005_g313_i01541035